MAIVNGPYKSPILFRNRNNCLCQLQEEKDCGNQPDGYSDGIQVHFYFMLWLASEWTLFLPISLLAFFLLQDFQIGYSF